MRIIRELFDSPLPFNSLSLSKEKWVASFEINKIVYDFEAIDVRGAWVIDFKNINEVFANTYNEFGVTGSGNAAMVFSTILSILKKFIVERKPKSFVFSGTGKSRVKLYRLFANKISSVLPEYKLIKEGSGLGDTIIFYFKKKGLW